MMIDPGAPASSLSEDGTFDLIGAPETITERLHILDELGFNDVILSPWDAKTLSPALSRVSSQKSSVPRLRRLQRGVGYRDRVTRQRQSRSGRWSPSPTTAVPHDRHERSVVRSRPMEKRPLTDRVALVTGSSRGIGTSIARALDHAGHASSS